MITMDVDSFAGRLSHTRVVAILRRQTLERALQLVDAITQGGFGGTRFVCTGGNTPTSTIDYLQSGAYAVGVGSSALPQEMIEEGRWADPSAHVADLVQRIRALGGRSYS